MQKDELFQMALKFLHMLEDIGIEIVIAGDTRDVQKPLPFKALQKLRLSKIFYLMHYPEDLFPLTFKQIISAIKRFSS